jgi:hypothetical protein
MIVLNIQLPREEDIQVSNTVWETKMKMRQMRKKSRQYEESVINIQSCEKWIHSYLELEMEKKQNSKKYSYSDSDDEY